MFKIQRDLIHQAARVAGGALVDSNDPNDPGQYLLFRANDGTFGLTVARQDVVARVLVDNAGTLLNSSSAVSFALKGKQLLSALGVYASPEMMDVDIKRNASPEPTAEGSDILDLGTVEFKIPGMKKAEYFGMQCVNLDVTPTIDETGKNTATVSGIEFVKYVTRVGMAAGKATFRPEFANAMLRARGNRFDIATASTSQLAWAKLDRIDTGNDFSTIVPYELLLAASKVMNEEQNVQIIFNEGSPGTVVFNQDFVFGGNTVGRLSFRITCSTEKFTRFEDIIEKTDFKFAAKFNTQIVKVAVDKLAKTNDYTKTQVRFSTTEKIMELGKQDGKFVQTSHAEMLEGSGGDLDLEVSIRHFKLAIDASDCQQTKVFFSGKKSLALVQCTDEDKIYKDAKFVAYFAPFREE